MTTLSTQPNSGTTAPRPASETTDHVACPFCGLLCDDLTVTRTGATLKVARNGCVRAAAGFERVLPATTPAIGGRAVSLAEAIAAAANLIAKARLPLYGGCATDVEGMRSLMALADRTGGVVDHALSEAQYRNFRVLQSSGWVMTTLTEVRNRADLIIIVGTDVHQLHPRFFERMICNDESMFAAPAPKRTVVFIGRGLDQSAATGARIGNVITLPCPPDRAGEVVAALRARLKGAPISAASIADVPLSAIDDLAQRCHAAAYGVFVWSAAALNYPGADLTVQAIADTVRDMTPTQRFAGLVLGGNEGSTSAASVSSWQSGFPLRVSFADGKPNYDPGRYAIARMLAAGEGDLLLWTSAFTPEITVPPTAIPTIVLGTPGLELATPPAVFIPVGTPGVDHVGRLIRCDSVVTLPLRNLHRSAHPSVAAVAGAIEAALQY